MVTIITWVWLIMSSRLELVNCYRGTKNSLLSSGQECSTVLVSTSSNTANNVFYRFGKDIFQINISVLCCTRIKPRSVLFHHGFIGIMVLFLHVFIPPWFYSITILSWLYSTMVLLASWFYSTMVLFHHNSIMALFHHGFIDIMVLFRHGFILPWFYSIMISPYGLYYAFYLHHGCIWILVLFSGNDRLMKEVSENALNPIGIVGMYSHFFADSTQRIAACE